MSPLPAKAGGAAHDVGGPSLPTGLTQKLMAAVRLEFRPAELDFTADDPVFGGSPCPVPQCQRVRRSGGLCWGHYGRWVSVGRPDLEKYIAETDARWRRDRLSSCPVLGCRYGRAQAGGLCSEHYQRWEAAGRPDLPRWLSTSPPLPAQPPPACAIDSCDLWAHANTALCWRHTRRWKSLGRPAIADYLHDQNQAVPEHERIDLRPLSAHLRLEMQYVLQRRRDDQTTRTSLSTARQVVRFLTAMKVGSLLDWPEETLSGRFRDDHRKAGTAHALLIYARRQIEDLHFGRGWEVEYPRDVWRLRNLGIDKPHATLRFNRIPQPELKELAKRLIRWRLSAGLNPNGAFICVAAITHLASFLAAPAIRVTHLARVDRQLLERYLAHLNSEMGGKDARRRYIGVLNDFFATIRRHDWSQALPATAMFFPEDYPKQLERLPRALAEHVMAQLEDPANLDRWDDPVRRLITLILMRCGLRISDAVKLAYDCIARDTDGAPYLRYVNHKMKREALVPIDEELERLITDQQRRVQTLWPQGVPALFPRLTSNIDGSRPYCSNTYRKALYRWVAHCDIRDEHGQPVRPTPHQWRHTLGTRLINRDVPQEVVRRILDHDSAGMTSHYARLHDTTVRRHWEQARKVNISGDTVTFEPGGQLAEATWAKQRLSRATQALPNGYCGLPLAKSCPHANSCLTCPTFLTTAEFLPQHRQQHQQTLRIISAAEARGQTRMAEMNQHVADNLKKIITALETDQDQGQVADAS